MQEYLNITRVAKIRKSLHTYELVSSKLHNRVHDMFLTFYALQIMLKISLFFHFNLG